MDTELDKLKQENFKSLKSSLDQSIEIGKTIQKLAKDYKERYDKEVKRNKDLRDSLAESQSQFNKAKELHDNLYKQHLKLLENNDVDRLRNDVDNLRNDVDVKRLKNEISSLKAEVKDKVLIIGALNKNIENLNKYSVKERKAAKELIEEYKNVTNVDEFNATNNSEPDTERIKSTINWLAIGLTAKYWAPVLIMSLLFLNALCTRR